MNKLFIIGNGFDLAHGIESTYEHFKNYLKLKYSGELSEWEDAKQRGEDISENSGIMFALLIEAIDMTEGGIWSNLEKTLGDLDYNYFLRHNDYRNEIRLLETLETRAEVFKELLYEWVHEINIGKANPKQDFIKLIGKGDLFFNFNYTKTLEDVYNVNADAITHLHGVAGESVKFGHGAGYRDEAGEEEQDVHEKFRKDTSKIAKEHSVFWKEQFPELQIKEIYSFGFSYGDVDQVYLTKLFESLGDTSDITWFFNSFDIEREEEFKDILEECGFNGKHAQYSVKS
ncbi:bacteriophage abortive infection AbiH family protein [Bacillus cereus]